MMDPSSGAHKISGSSDDHLSELSNLLSNVMQIITASRVIQNSNKYKKRKSTGASEKSASSAAEGGVTGEQLKRKLALTENNVSEAKIQKMGK